MRVGAVLAHGRQFTEKIVLGIGAEIAAFNFTLQQVRHQAAQVLNAPVSHAKSASGVRRVTAALLFRRAFKQGHPRPLFAGGKGCAKPGIAAAQHDDVVRLHTRS
ncbi:hypothetical protein D3C87_1865890 [compost metagenome]